MNQLAESSPAQSDNVRDGLLAKLRQQSQMLPPLPKQCMQLFVYLTEIVLLSFLALLLIMLHKMMPPYAQWYLEIALSPVIIFVGCIIGFGVSMLLFRRYRGLRDAVNRGWPLAGMLLWSVGLYFDGDMLALPLLLIFSVMGLFALMGSWNVQKALLGIFHLALIEPNREPINVLADIVRQSGSAPKTK